MVADVCRIGEDGCSGDPRPGNTSAHCVWNRELLPCKHKRNPSIFVRGKYGWRRVVHNCRCREPWSNAMPIRRSYRGGKVWIFKT